MEVDECVGAVGVPAGEDVEGFAQCNGRDGLVEEDDAGRGLVRSVAEVTGDALGGGQRRIQLGGCGTRVIVGQAEQTRPARNRDGAVAGDLKYAIATCKPAETSSGGVLRSACAGSSHCIRSQSWEYLGSSGDACGARGDH